MWPEGTLFLSHMVSLIAAGGLHSCMWPEATGLSKLLQSLSTAETDAHSIMSQWQCPAAPNAAATVRCEQVNRSHDIFSHREYYVWPEPEKVYWLIVFIIPYLLIHSLVYL